MFLREVGVLGALSLAVSIARKRTQTAPEHSLNEGQKCATALEPLTNSLSLSLPDTADVSR